MERDRTQAFKLYHNSQILSVKCPITKFMGLQILILDYLKANNIDRIVVAAHHTEARFPLDLEYLKLDIDDSPTEDLMPHFGPVLAFIQKNPHTNVLIHCASGISRSATFAIAYVMKAGGMEYEKAREFVASKRPCVHPNSGFQKQLERLGEMFSMIRK